MVKTLGGERGGGASGAFGSKDICSLAFFTLRGTIVARKKAWVRYIPIYPLCKRKKKNQQQQRRRLFSEGVFRNVLPPAEGGHWNRRINCSKKALSKENVGPFPLTVTGKEGTLRLFSINGLMRDEDPQSCFEKVLAVLSWSKRRRRWARKIKTTCSLHSRMDQHEKGIVFLKM